MGVGSHSYMYKILRKISLCVNSKKSACFIKKKQSDNKPYQGEKNEKSDAMYGVDVGSCRFDASGNWANGSGKKWCLHRHSTEIHFPIE